MYCRLWIELGKTYERKDDYEEAIQVFKTDLNCPSWNAKILPRLLFRVYKANEKYDEAIHLFEDAISDPKTLNWSTDVKDVIEVYQVNGNLDGAIKAFENLIHTRIYFRKTWALSGLMQAYIAKDEGDRVIKVTVDQAYISTSKFLELNLLDARIQCEGRLRRSDQ